MIYDTLSSKIDYLQKICYLCTEKMNYIQVYGRLPIELAIHIADYDSEPKKHMQVVFQELKEYHYMEWVDYNTPGGWAGRFERDWD